MRDCFADADVLNEIATHAGRRCVLWRGAAASCLKIQPALGDIFAAICLFKFSPLWSRQRRARRGQKMRCGCSRNMNHHFDSHSCRPTFPVGAIMAMRLHG